MLKPSNSVCVFVLILTTVHLHAADDKAEKPTKAKIAEIKIKGSLPESVSQPGIFGELEQNLAGMIGRLDQAATDDEIAAVLLRIREPSIGRGKLAELSAAIQRVRDSEKRVIAELESATTAGFLLATHCDEIVMPESGVLMIPGVRAEITFYRGLFDKLGIKADMMQVGAFKGAAEPYTRSEMSPEFRKQYEGLLDDVYEQLVDAISANRKLDRAKVQELIDVGLFTTVEAQQSGLIDRVAYDDTFQEDLRKTLDVDELEMVKNYGKKKPDTDFSGMMGMMKLFELMMGGEPSRRASRNKKIAVVYASGMIMDGESTASLFGGEILGGDTIVRAIRKAQDDKSVAAIVLRVDSPGGSAMASDMIWHAIEQCDKPVIASMGDVAASGGYYISMGCDKIFAEPGTLTGSIGVVGGKIALTGLYGKVGLNTDVISRGKNSGLLSIDQPFSDSERVVWKKMMEDVYRQFVEKAAAGRDMKAEQIEPLTGGRVWTGRQAKEKGLIDDLGTLREAIAFAKQQAGIGEDEKAELLILPKPKSIFDQLFDSGIGIQSDFASQAAKSVPELSRHLRTVERLRKLFTKPAVCIMPYEVRIK
ncbi:MAG: signal peptide peptidase SppA [Planctomycetaceae bacterium]|nr:signal peptide peptidase SppA [Planctomycetaceae bacterium]